MNRASIWITIIGILLSSCVAFAIVLLSADDIAYNKNSKPEDAKYRARQNTAWPTRMSRIKENESVEQPEAPE